MKIKRLVCKLLGHIGYEFFNSDVNEYTVRHIVRCTFCGDVLWDETREYEVLKNLIDLEKEWDSGRLKIKLD